MNECCINSCEIAMDQFHLRRHYLNVPVLIRNHLKLLIAAKCQDILQLNFWQIFPAVLPGKGHSGSMTLLKVVLCRENDPFSQPRDWIEVSKCWALTFWHLRNNGAKIIQQTLQTLPSLRSHIMKSYGFLVMCNVTLKCYVTGETSSGNYARCAVQTSM